MATDFTPDIDAIQHIEAVPRILEIVCRSTGMGFAAEWQMDLLRGPGRNRVWPSTGR
jgi:hypothetical protein